jgi:hypothetical protein
VDCNEEEITVTSAVYLFRLRPQAGFSVELRVTAPSVSVARREVRHFLEEHAGSTWLVERVAREPSLLHPHPLVAPYPNHA